MCHVPPRPSTRKAWQQLPLKTPKRSGSCSSGSSGTALGAPPAPLSAALSAPLRSPRAQPQVPPQDPWVHQQMPPRPPDRAGGAPRTPQQVLVYPWGLSPTGSPGAVTLPEPWMALLHHGDPKTTRYQPCPSVRPSINQSINQSISPSLRLSTSPSRCPRLSYGLIQIIINAN